MVVVKETGRSELGAATTASGMIVTVPSASERMYGMREMCAVSSKQMGTGTGGWAVEYTWHSSAVDHNSTVIIRDTVLIVSEQNLFPNLSRHPWLILYIQSKILYRKMCGWCTVT